MEKQDTFDDILSNESISPEEKEQMAFQLSIIQKMFQARREVKPPIDYILNLEEQDTQ